MTVGDKRWARVLAGALALLALGGCWDRRELEDVAFVLAVGVDPGPANDLEVSLMIAVPNKLGGEGGGGGFGEPVMITRVRTPALAEANTIANAYINRYVSMQHLKSLIINEDFVRQGRLGELLDTITRLPALRRTTAVIISRGNAGDLLAEAKPGLERAPNRYLELLAATDAFTGMTPRDARVHELATQLENPGGVPLLYLAAVHRDDEGAQGTAGTAAPAPGEGGGPLRLLPGAVPRRGGPNVDLVGAVAYHRNGIAGELSGREVRVVNMVRGEFERAAVSFPDPLRPRARVTVELKRAAPPQVRPYWEDGRIAFRVLVPLEAQLLGVQSRLDYTREDRLYELEAALAQELAADAAEVFRRTQQWRADVFLLGYKAARLFATYPAWRAYDWEAHYPEVRADIRFRVRVRRFGDQLSPARPLEEKRAPGPAGARGAGGD